MLGKYFGWNNDVSLNFVGSLKNVFSYCDFWFEYD